jgi:hypothetical protein
MWRGGVAEGFAAEERKHCFEHLGPYRGGRRVVEIDGPLGHCAGI